MLSRIPVVAAFQRKWPHLVRRVTRSKIQILEDIMRSTEDYVEGHKTRHSRNNEILM